MATRKQIQAVRKMLGETHRASNLIMAKEGYRSRSDNHKPFEPTPGSTKRYLAWCQRMKLDPSQRRCFDGYFGTKTIMEKYYPSSQFTMTPERFEAFLGAGSPRRTKTGELNTSTYDLEHQGESWWALVSIFKTQDLEKCYDYEPGYNPNRLVHLRIRISYTFFHDHQEIDPHWTITFNHKHYGIKGRVTLEYHPANNWSTMEEVALDLAELTGRKISWEEKKTVATRFQPYVYRKPPKGVKWQYVRPGLSRKRGKLEMDEDGAAAALDLY